MKCPGTPGDPPALNANRIPVTVPAFDNSYARLPERFYARVDPLRPPAPSLIALNRDLASELGFDPDWLASQEGLDFLTGRAVAPGSEPIATAYAGHQFGNFVPQLGDGRAILLGEIVNTHGQRRDIQLKGSGRTPFSRGGDGRAALGPVLREYLVSEAMAALHIPTTRSLAASATGDSVRREAELPGAVLVRVASSHIRVGTFQFLAARQDFEGIRLLADHVIARHYPDACGAEQPYRALLEHVVIAQADLIARWMLVGFIHGVMNTDNMSVAGETIDYGPCAFLDAYDPATVFSSIDHGGRYAFGKQPEIALWNLARLAETLLPLLSDDQKESVTIATNILGTFPILYHQHSLHGQRAKLGLRDPGDANPDADSVDSALAADWLTLLQAQQVDYTLAWRRLGDAAAGDEAPLRALFADSDAPDTWLARWHARCADESTSDGAAVVVASQRAKAMNRVNPIIIPRNHRVEEALAAASGAGDLLPFERLLAALRNPCEETAEGAAYAEPAAAAVTACYRTFCGT